MGLEITCVAGTGTQPKPMYLVSGPNEAQVLDVSYKKEFSERQSDRKKWIYSDSERSTLHRQECGPSQRVSAALKHGMVSFYRLGNFIC